MILPSILIWLLLGFISYLIIIYKTSTLTKGVLLIGLLCSPMGLFIAAIYLLETYPPKWWDDRIFKEKVKTEQRNGTGNKTAKMDVVKNKVTKKPKKSQKKAK